MPSSREWQRKGVNRTLTVSILFKTLILILWTFLNFSKKSCVSNIPELISILLPDHPQIQPILWEYNTGNTRILFSEKGTGLAQSMFRFEEESQINFSANPIPIWDKMHKTPCIVSEDKRLSPISNHLLLPKLWRVRGGGSAFRGRASRISAGARQKASPSLSRCFCCPVTRKHWRGPQQVKAAWNTWDPGKQVTREKWTITSSPGKAQTECPFSWHLSQSRSDNPLRTTQKGNSPGNTETILHADERQL